MHMMRRELTGWLAFALVAAGYLFFASRNIALPGLWADEATQACAGMKSALKLPPEYEGWGVHVAGRWLPLNDGGEYDLSGFFLVYAALAFKLGGASVRTLRWASLLFGLGILTAFYALVRSWFSRRLALVCAVLLAVDPVFLIWSRLTFYICEWPDVLFGLCAALFGTLWHKKKYLSALCAATFILGFSLNASIKSLAPILGLSIIYFVFAPRSRRPSFKQAAAGAAAFVLGALNPILYNVYNRFTTVTSLWRDMNSTTMWGDRNWNILGHLRINGPMLLSTISGAPASATAGIIPPNMIAVRIYSAALILALAICAIRRPRRLLALLALEALMFFFTLFSPSGLTEQHLVVLWPFAVLVLVLAADWVYQRESKAAKIAAAAGLLLLACSDVRFDAAYFRMLESTGGVERYTDAIYRLADYLADNKILSPYALSLEMTDSICVATQARVSPVRAHNYFFGLSPRLKAQYSAIVVEPGARYLMMSDYIRQNTGIVFGYYDAFREAARKAGRKLVIEKTIYDRAGDPVYFVYRAERP